MEANVNNHPYNLEAEQTLLGCILIDGDIQLEIITALKQNDFYVEGHRLIFEAMTELVSGQNVVDQVTLMDLMEKKGTLSKIGVAYITGLVRGVPSSSNYKHYLEIVKRDSLLRKLIKASSDILNDAGNSVDAAKSLQFAEQSIFDISDENDTSNLVDLSHSYGGVLETFQKIAEDKDFLRGLMTGYTKVDDMLNGFKGGQFIVLAARPAIGKTTLAMNIVFNIAERHQVPVAVFSLEMSKEELAQRMLCSVARVSISDGVKGKLTAENWEKLNNANKRLNDVRILVDDTAMTTVPQMLSKCRRIKAKYGLGLIVVDHIQLIRSAKSYDGNARHQEVSDISRDLKMLAKELNVPVLALSQLSRGITGRKGGVPMLSDLKESGSIEQDADIVMFIHRPDKMVSTEEELKNSNIKKNVAEIRVEKNRSGSTGVAELLFKPECTKFINPPKGYFTDENAPRETFRKNEILSQEEDYSGEEDFGEINYDENDIPPEEQIEF